jgi:WD40 repeat protein
MMLFGALFTHAYADGAAQLIVLKPTHPPAKPNAKLHSVDRLTFSADGSRLLVVLDESATLWNLATRKPAGFDLPPRKPGPDPGGVTVISTNGGAFFVAVEGKGNFVLHDTATGAARGAVRFPPQQASGFPIVPTAVISRDGKWMACAFNSHPWGSPRGVVNGKPLPMEPCRVILFDTRTGAPRHTWTPKTKDPVIDKSAGPQPPQDLPHVFALEFSPTGQYLAAATIDGNVTVYDTAAGREVGVFNEWNEQRTIAPTPGDLHQEMFTWMDDGKSVIMPASLLLNQTPRWTVTGKEVRDVRLPAENLASLAQAPRAAAAATPPPRPRSHLPTPSEQMRESQEHLTGKPAAPDTGANGGELACKAFSADGKYAVAAFTIRTDGNAFNKRARVSIADLAAGRNLGSVHGITGAVTFIRFSPDGKKVAWGAEDQTVYVCPVDALTAMAANQQQIR